jgi:sulfoxide reductase heme-binding subunit YedZ
MMITPMMLALGGRGWLVWLKARRRYIGVAAFGYAALHLLFWLKHATVMSFLQSFIRLEVLPGWIAFFLMAAMAWTSTDGAVRRMGPKWKRLQRWVYPAAVLTLVHWAMTTEHLAEVVIYSAPLVLLSLWRVIRRINRARSRGSAA